MSKGILIFAYNSTINYVSIATVAARLAKKYLDLPVTLVTNVDWADRSVFDQVINQDLVGTSYQRVFNFAGRSHKTQWHNQNRSSAYELSPYDQTLLIDADYLIFNNNHKKLFDTNLEFACYNKVLDVTGWQGLQQGARVGNPGIPMQWATVVYFTKNPLAKALFDYMGLIKKEYKYFSAVYNYTMELFRNDYTLSMALQTLTGYNQSNFTAIPGALISANTTVEILEVRPNGDIVFNWTYGKSQTVNVTRINGTSVHIMNKQSITDPRILNELEGFAR